MARDLAQVPAAEAAHVLRFMSLFHPGRGLAVPCNEQGEVDTERLPESLRRAYLGACASVGRDYACPVVEPVH